MNTISPGQTRRARYGIDAPGVLATLLATGVGAEALAFGLTRVASTKVLRRCGMAAAVAAAIPLGLGLSFLTYVLVGKLRTRDRMLAMTPWSGDEQVLDIGTGAGLLAFGAAKRLTTGRVVGIDIWSAKDLSNNHRAVALANAAAEGVADRVSVIDGDARRLDFPDRSFDRVLSLLCLHNIEDASERRGACFEIARVLKPGGVAVVGDYVPVNDYASAFEAAGLEVTAQHSAFATALGPMWIVAARKGGDA